MVDYEKFLNNLKVGEVKDIVRSVLKHIKIKLTGAKKKDLILHLLKHTYMEGDEIVLKEEYVDNLYVSKVVSDVSTKLSPKKLTESQLTKKKDDLIKQIGKTSGIITRKEKELNNLTYEGVISGEKTTTKKKLKDTDKEQVKILEKELNNEKDKLKVLRKNYSKVKDITPEKKMKKVKQDDFVEDSEFKKKKELVRLRAKFDRLKKDLEDEQDSKKRMMIEIEIKQVKDDFNNLRKIKV